LSEFHLFEFRGAKHQRKHGCGSGRNQRGCYILSSTIRQQHDSANGRPVCCQFATEHFQHKPDGNDSKFRANSIRPDCSWINLSNSAVFLFNKLDEPDDSFYIGGSFNRDDDNYINNNESGSDRSAEHCGSKHSCSAKHSSIRCAGINSNSAQLSGSGN
jgi:hypothetical protein